jgi:hypothetical protein
MMVACPHIPFSSDSWFARYLQPFAGLFDGLSSTEKNRSLSQLGDDLFWGTARTDLENRLVLQTKAAQSSESYLGVLTINPQLGVDCLSVSSGNSRDTPEIDPERFLSISSVTRK